MVYISTDSTNPTKPMPQPNDENPFMNVKPLYPEDDGDVSLLDRDDIELPGEENDDDNPGDEENEDTDTDTEDEDTDTDDKDTEDDSEDDDDGEDDDEENDDTDDDDMEAKIAKAREKALKKVEGDDDATDAINKRFDALEKQIKDGKSSDTKGKEWYEDGVDADGKPVNPPSWSELIKHIKQEAVKTITDTIEQSNNQRSERIGQLEREANSLIDEGLIEKDELPQLVEFMKKVKSPDLITAFEGYREVRGVKQVKKQTTQQRKKIASKMNRGERPSLKLKKPNYAQIAARTLDDIVDDAMRGVKMG